MNNEIQDKEMPINNQIQNNEIYLNSEIKNKEIQTNIEIQNSEIKIIIWNSLKFHSNINNSQGRISSRWE